jgi:hypothetical protein
MIDGIDLALFSPPCTVADLQRTNCAEIPTGSGVYMVLRPNSVPPEFLERSVGGWFKNKNPTVELPRLNSKWIDKATVLYIGKAAGAEGLKQRLHQYMRFGRGQTVGHWGGRFIWQLVNHQNLLICWRETTKDRAAILEKELLRKFITVHGRLLFANLT